MSTLAPVAMPTVDFAEVAHKVGLFVHHLLLALVFLAEFVLFICWVDGCFYLMISFIVVQFARAGVLLLRERKNR